MRRRRGWAAAALRPCRLAAAVLVCIDARSPAHAYHLAPPPPPGSLLAAAVGDVLEASARHMAGLNLSSVATGAPTLLQTFNNTFTFTATKTWSMWNATGTPDGTVFVDTGDIQQQWLRDSANQLRPYVALARSSAHVAEVFVQSLRRMSRFFVDDVYGSAFNPYAEPQHDKCPKTLRCPNCTCQGCAPACSTFTYQHNYEMDSYCYVVDLAHRFW